MRNIKSILGLTITFLSISTAQICGATTPYESKVFNATSLSELADNGSPTESTPKRINISLALHGIGRANLILEKTDSQPAHRSTVTYRGIRLVPYKGNGKRLGKRNVDWASATLSQEEDGNYILFSLVTTNREGFSRFYRGTLKLGENKAKISSTPQFFLASKTCENNDLKSLALRSGAGTQLTAELNTAAWTQLKELELGLYIDSFAASKLGSRAVSKSTEAVNAVSAIYERDLGIKVTLSSSFTEPANSTSSFFETNSSSLLESFRDSLNRSKKLGSPDAAFLYTGREIDSNIIGLAFLDSVCAAPNYAYGLFQRVSDSLDYIILAHELGHTLSANHERAGIMAASLSDKAPTNFSDKSKEEITSFVDNFGKCLNDVAITPEPSPAPVIVPPQPTFNIFDTTPKERSPAPKVSIGGGLKGRNLTLLATVAQNNPGCKLSIKMANSRLAIASAKPLSEFSLSTIQTRITSSINMRTRDARELFLAVEHSCPGVINTTSNVLRLRTSSVSAKVSYNSRDFLRRLRFKFSPVVG